MGHDCLDAGIAATPTCGVLTREHAAAGGVQISASHNPPEYNGFKLFSTSGRVLPGRDGEEVANRYRRATWHWAAHDSLGQIDSVADTVACHAALILKTVDIERIRGRRFKVLLDANHGAGSLLGRHLCEALGCQLTLLGEEPDGMFDHGPEPTEDNVSRVAARVRQLGMDVGFCQDPDADRLAVIDEQGTYLGEEATLALCVAHVLAQSPGPIVTNCSTSRMSEDLARRHGVPFHRSAVGEANVVDVMLRQNAVLGGEGNGGVIDPRVGLVRDSFVGMAQLLDAMAARQCRISQLAANLPRYAITKTKVQLRPEEVASALDRLELHFTTAAPSHLDGLRLDWPDRWLLVRASNTEPIVRIVAEADTRRSAAALCDEAARILQAQRPTT
jgi:phosphomannomutase